MDDENILDSWTKREVVVVFSSPMDPYLGRTKKSITEMFLCGAVV